MCVIGATIHTLYTKIDDESDSARVRDRNDDVESIYDQNLMVSGHKSLKFKYYFKAKI